MTPQSLDPLARARRDAHLEAVGAALAGLPDVNRAAILADLTAQLDEMLAGATTPASIAAVMARLDAPADFAGSSTASVGAAPSALAPAHPQERLGRVALIAAILALPVAVLVGFLASWLRPGSAELGFLCFIACEVAALSLGIVTRQGRSGRAAVRVAGGILALTVIAFVMLVSRDN